MCPSFGQNSTWTSGIDLIVRDGDCIKPLLKGCLVKLNTCYLMTYVDFKLNYT